MQMHGPRPSLGVRARPCAAPLPHSSGLHSRRYQWQQLHRSNRCTRPAAAAAAAEGQDSTSSSSASGQLPGKRFSVTLPKPVGVVFTQKEGGPVFIESVVPGGNADKAGLKAGDILNQCSAVTLKKGKEGRYEKEGYGDRPYDNWEVIMIDTEGLKFETVMNALKSNNERWGIKTVTLVVRRVGAQ